MINPGFKKDKAETAKSVLDIGDKPITNMSMPPEGDALPPGTQGFDISAMNRSERRRLGRLHSFKIQGTNKPFIR